MTILHASATGATLAQQKAIYEQLKQFHLGALQLGTPEAQAQTMGACERAWAVYMALPGATVADLTPPSAIKPVTPPAPPTGAPPSDMKGPPMEVRPPKIAATVVPPAPDEPPGTVAPGTVQRAQSKMIFADQQLEIFKGCVYVQDLHAIIVPGVDAPLDKQRFDVRFSGVYQYDPTNAKTPVDSAWDCFTSSLVFKFPRVDATYFDPRDPAGKIKTESGMTFVNTYVPLEIVKTPGDAKPFIDHIKKILPNGNDAWILIAYLAACAQNPGVKATWAPLLQGVEGNGKSIISEIMSYAMGERYTHPARASKIDARFNSHLYGKLFIVINEVKVTQDKQSVWETLKTLITDRAQEIEYKNGAVVKRQLCFNIFFSTNHENAIAKTANDRRICPLFCAQQSAEDLIRDGMLDSNGHTSAYFKKLFGWLRDDGGFAIVAHFLSTHPIPDDLNFAKDCTRAPRTTATDKAILAGLDGAEQEVMEAISEGSPGFRGGWIAGHSLNQWLDRSPRGRAVALNKRRDILKALGYVPHPGLPDGRVPVPLPLPDGQRPRLYIKRGHTSEGLRGVDVAAAYLKDQSAPGVGGGGPVIPPAPNVAPAVYVPPPRV